MLTEHYATFLQNITRLIPEERIIQDELRTLAYGTDASFYRLIPKLVVKVETEEEVIRILRESGSLGLPVTFRGAGTSLSGQAISDSILILLGPSWTRYVIGDEGRTIRLQPGIVGSHANMYLAPFGRKIGPDPASINSAMIGGIAANNASGMCCGTAQNSYRTLASMRIVFADGAVLDTGETKSRESFATTHPQLLVRIQELADRVKQNQDLAERIRRKFRMKNTTGYSVNALVDFDDPFEIIQHLLIGSEGTLGFISEITYNTVPELPHKASSLMLFPDIETACQAAVTLKGLTVDAVELMDRASLRSVEEKEGMPGYLRSLDASVASLLVETRADSPGRLRQQIGEITSSLERYAIVRPVEFTDVPAEFTMLWNIRKGLFPSVGAMRKTGTTVIIEDVAFPLDRLAEATLQLQSLFVKHGYQDAIIFGHALEGNLHFVFKQDFHSTGEIERYRAFLEEVTSMVVTSYDGSLKAEHGTGRNMAPFVELEWGSETFAIMREIKDIFDPRCLLNPGVILNDDKSAHIRHLKPLPAAHPIIDKCIECGFCEVHCPSRNLTLTPRQRIVVYRELVRLRSTGDDPRRLAALQRDFPYQGEETCATDGLCATSCPVGIDTGKLIKELRAEGISPTTASIAGILADNMHAVTALMRLGLNIIDSLHGLIGTGFMTAASVLLRKLSGGTIPQWNKYMPGGADALKPPKAFRPDRPTVVYFPSCINRTMGIARGEEPGDSVTTVARRLLERAECNVVYPARIAHLCCGMAYASKGFKAIGDKKARELEQSLLDASHKGEYPVLVDMSPCLFRMKECFTSGLKLYEPVQFIAEHLVDRLTFKKLPRTVAVHTTCSAEKMGLAGNLESLAGLCAEKVVVPAHIGCCGWAGDRGFTRPELNASALARLRSSLPADCEAGYSTSRTCEIGLSVHSGIPYSSILHLVDECTVGND